MNTNEKAAARSSLESVRKSIRVVKVSYVREPCGTYVAGPVIRHGADVAQQLRAMVGDSTREHFIAFLLNSRHRLQAAHVCSIGTAGNTMVHPREVFQAAIVANASAVVVAHNHPSGDPTPSGDDRSVTDRLKAAGQLIGIEVLDHIILGGDRFYSFAEDAILQVGR